MRYIATAFMVSTLLGGCANTMSGLDGGSQFSCKAPDGVTCSSLSGVYANAVANNLPALRKEGRGIDGGRSEGSPGTIVGSAPESGSPIRTQPKILRIWIAPWEDDEGDLHDQSFLYVVADQGRWLIEHNRKRIADRYRPTFVQSGAGEAAQKPATQSGQQSPGGVSLPSAQMYGQVAIQPHGKEDQE